VRAAIKKFIEVAAPQSALPRANKKREPSIGARLPNTYRENTYQINNRENDRVPLTCASPPDMGKNAVAASVYADPTHTN
jgi:hypothetical protein